MGVLIFWTSRASGLHQRDNDRLIQTLEHMRDLGNTLIVVEHDEDTMMAADYIIDIGPGAGIHGGRVVAAGTPEEVMQCEESLPDNICPGAASSLFRKRAASRMANVLLRDRRQPDLLSPVPNTTIDVVAALAAGYARQATPRSGQTEVDRRAGAARAEAPRARQDRHEPSHDADAGRLSLLSRRRGSP